MTELMIDASEIHYTAGSHIPNPPNEQMGQDELNTLAGKRVLIVEDEFFVALEVEEALQSFGCETVGPFLNLEKAMSAAGREEFDLAVLDINLDRTMVYPLADELNDKKIPFVFVTGYAESDLPEQYRLEMRVQKPFAFFELRRAIEERLSWNDPPRS